MLAVPAARAMPISRQLSQLIDSVNGLRPSRDCAKASNHRFAAVYSERPINGTKEVSDEHSTTRSSAGPAKQSTRARVPASLGESTDSTRASVWSAMRPPPGTPAAWISPWTGPKRSTASSRSLPSAAGSAASAEPTITSAPRASHASNCATVVATGSSDGCDASQPSQCTRAGNGVRPNSSRRAWAARAR